MTNVLHLVHSVDPTTGGVAEAVNRLNDEMNSLGLNSSISDIRKYKLEEPTSIVAHGLWQWPSIEAYHRFKNIIFLTFISPWYA